MQVASGTTTGRGERTIVEARECSLWSVVDLLDHNNRAANLEVYAIPLADDWLDVQEMRRIQLKCIMPGAPWHATFNHGLSISSEFSGKSNDIRASVPQNVRAIAPQIC